MFLTTKYLSFMKTYLFKMLTAISFTGLLFGCSLVGLDDSKEYDLEELVPDDYVGETWDGTGIPSWLEDRYTNDFYLDLHWGFSSYWGAILIRAFTFEYNKNVLVALTCDNFGNKTYESVTMCYTTDGRKVDFERVKRSFKKSASMIYSNALDGERTPKVSDFDLESSADLGWLQAEIDKVCQSVNEPQQVLAGVTCGNVSEDGQSYIVLEFTYFDSKKVKDGPVTVRKAFYPDGQLVDKGVNGKYLKESTVWLFPLIRV